MWDRFLLKYRVRPIQEDRAFKEMMVMKDSPIKTSLSLDEIHEAQADVEDIDIPDEVMEHIIQIRKELKSNGIMPSDRRYRKSTKVIKAESWLNGHSKVTADDLLVLSHVLWDDIDHISKVREIITEITNPYLREADELYDAVMDVWNCIERADEKDKLAIASEGSTKIKRAINTLKELQARMEADGRNTDRIEDYIQKSNGIWSDRILGDIMKL